VRPAVTALCFILIVAASAAGAQMGEPEIPGFKPPTITAYGDGADAIAAVVLPVPPGFKIGWRIADGNGLETSIACQGAAGTAGLALDWPAPKRFAEPYGPGSPAVVGYDGDVTILLRARERASPPSLRLRIEYGLCDDVCIPVSAEVAVPAGAPAAPGPDARARPQPLPAVADGSVVRVRAPPAGGGQGMSAFVDGRMIEAGPAVARAGWLEFAFGQPVGATGTALVFEAGAVFESVWGGMPPSARVPCSPAP